MMEKAKRYASETRMTQELEQWERRGCLYVFEHYDEALHEGDSNGIVVYAYGQNDVLLWDGCTSWQEGDTVAEVLRWAREAWEVAKADARS